MLNEELQEVSLEQIKRELEEVKSSSELILQRRYQKKGVKWWNIPCGFDTETTSTRIDGRKVCWVYELTFGIGNKIYMMRTIEEFVKLCELVQEVFELDEFKRIACYIHNAGFDFEYIQHDMEWREVFSVDSHRPLKMLNSMGIEFRDNAILSAESLDKTAEHLHSHVVHKLVGELDYSLIRTPSTPLTPNEWQYCINDVAIILAYIEEQIEEYKDVAHIPMTNTGRVRLYFREQCLISHKEDGSVALNKNGKPARNHGFIDLIHNETMNDEIYRWSKLAFRGGFTHANVRHVNRLLRNVASYDLTSAYPSMAVSKLFPVGKPAILRPENKFHFLNALKVRACLFYVEFINLERKYDAPDSYISWIPNKMNGVNVKDDDNGRIVHADKLGMWMTEIDWEIINKVYDYDSFRYPEYMYVWFKKRLPKEFVKGILKLYADKTVFKGDPTKKKELMKAKGMLNSSYGMMVQDPLKEITEYEDGEWSYKPNETTIDTYNNRYNRFTYYPQGLWITAYCRQRVWDAILNAGKNRYCYTDTDSIKVLRWWELKQWFEDYNEMIRKEMYEAMDYYKLPHELVEPKGKLLGVFDFEGVYGEFKTLGAKRYMVSEPIVEQHNDECFSCLRKKYEITVAGLPKDAINWFTKVSNPFDRFTNNCVIPSSDSHKRLHTYVGAWEGDVVDYLGNKEHIVSNGGVHLEPMEFSMKEVDKFVNFILEVEEWDSSGRRWY